MKLTNQEEFIKKKMQSYEPDVDKDALWNSLEKHVPEKEKRRGFIYYQIAASIMLMGLVALLFKIPNLSIKEKQIPAKVPVHSTSSKNYISDTNKTIENISETKDKKVKKDKEIAKSCFTDNNDNSLKTKIRKQNISEAKLNKKLNTDLQKNVASHNITVEKDFNNEMLTGQNKNEELLKAVIISKIKILPLEYQHNLVLMPEKSINFRFSSNKYFMLNMNIGSGLVEQSYNAKKHESEDYLNYLTSVSNSKPSIGLDVGISYILSEKIYLNSGLQFKRLTTEVHSKMTQILQEEVETLEGLIQRLTKKIEYEAVGYNYHYLLDCPVNIGVYIFENSNVKIGVQCGIALNLYTVSNGKMLDKNYKLYYYNNTSDNHYNKRFSLGWQSSVVIDYKLGDNFYLSIKPGFSTQKIKYNIDNIYLNEFYRIFNLNVGLKHRI